MPVGEQQQLITEIVSFILGVRAEPRKSFGWFRNTHTPEDFGTRFSLIDQIFVTLGGNPKANKRICLLNCDAYFGGRFNFIFEFDEHQHFSSARLKTLQLYPPDLPVAFDLQAYGLYCQKYYLEADKYRRSKTTTDFNFLGGRTAQRAYLDCFRDILPTLHGLNPTVRVAEFEVRGVTGNDAQGQAIVEQVLDSKFKRG